MSIISIQDLTKDFGAVRAVDGHESGIPASRADEPANGLDPKGIRRLRDFLRTLAAEGRTVLLSSHVLSEVAQTVDEVVVINHGRLITHSALDALNNGAGPRALGVVLPEITAASSNLEHVFFDLTITADLEMAA